MERKMTYQIKCKYHDGRPYSESFETKKERSEMLKELLGSKYPDGSEMFNSFELVGA